MLSEANLMMLVICLSLVSFHFHQNWNLPSLFDRIYRQALFDLVDPICINTLLLFVEICFRIIHCRKRLFLDLVSKSFSQFSLDGITKAGCYLRETLPEIALMKILHNCFPSSRE